MRETIQRMGYDNISGVKMFSLCDHTVPDTLCLVSPLVLVSPVDTGLIAASRSQHITGNVFLESLVRNFDL